MSDFINTVDVLGDAVVTDSIIDRSIAEYNDNNINRIGTYAFNGCSRLTSVDFPVATTIGMYAFYGCSNLTSVDFPVATSVSGYAFRDCSNLTSVDFPVATSVGSNAFQNCSNLTSVDFPVATSVGSNAFQNCFSLTAVILRSETLCSLLNTNAFSNCYHFSGTVNSTYNPTGAKDGYIYVPRALIDQYKSATNWSTYASQFRVLEDYTDDGTTTGEFDPNRHMVRFFNDDGTLLGYKVVATGSDAAYDGDTPVHTQNASWKFTGFEPSPTNVTADMDCYAKYLEPISFADASWAEIAAISESGTAADNFAIGDTKTVPVTVNGTTYDYVVKIVGFDHDNLADGTGKAGISLMTFTLGDTALYGNEYSSDATNYCFDQYSGIAKAITALTASFPTELVNVIKPVNKYKKYKNNTTLTGPSAYSYWIPNSMELLGASDYFQDVSTIYPAFANARYGLGENCVYSRDDAVMEAPAAGMWLVDTGSNYPFYYWNKGTSMAHVSTTSTCNAKRYYAFGFCV